MTSDGDGRHPGPERWQAPGRQRRVTIREVADLAHVSLGTVSNVLNNPSVVAPSTRERVREAIRQAGFVRSTAAQQLRGGRSRMIGVVVLDIANPFFTEMVRGAEHVLREHGYVLMLCSTEESPEQERRYMRILEEHRVDGLLITPAEQDLDRVVEFAGHGIPTVLIDRERGAQGLCSATVDDVRGGELAARHLMELGHREIAFLNGPVTIRQCADRRKGARRAMRSLGQRAGASLVEIGVASTTVEHGEAAVPQLLALDPPPTGVICANDLLALGVLRGLAAAGRSVPGDVAVVGYDDVTFASMLSPALTSVRQPKYELGAAAAELLLEETSGNGHEHRDVRFEPELVVRASSGSGPR
ncbi:MAG TPA: LacI family DNA-binding transcriptional regulator [Acidimicrobiales bacterium]|nr:LacI family DNA-binding transcriptional regulator [Acidimicrobiales bacterium]